MRGTDSDYATCMTKLAELFYWRFLPTREARRPENPWTGANIPRGIASPILIGSSSGPTIDGVNGQEIQDTWAQIKRRYGEDVAQDLLYQAFEKASRGKVEKPLHYAAVSALHIAIDQDKRQANTLAYYKALSGKRLAWEPEYGKAVKPLP